MALWDVKYTHDKFCILVFHYGFIILNLETEAVERKSKSPASSPVRSRSGERKDSRSSSVSSERSRSDERKSDKKRQSRSKSRYGN